mmetsp:Transcript_68941/g.135482  ORF Transcript_68941/g.135482 Transcript_68941/m.135482 type:complete len:641 (+) Transcript_68941:77-1999(+)
MINMTKTALVFAALHGLLSPAAEAAFYLPGVAPVSYSTRKNVPLFVNKVTSTKTQLPYSYYDLPFCRPKHAKQTSENLGEVLEGDTIKSSLYELEMKVPDGCKILCKKNHNKADMRLFRSIIDDEYRIDWIVDGLPGAMRNEEYDYVTRGFPVGFVAPPAFEGGRKMHFLYNHVRIVLKYHEDAAAFNGARIVGFQIIPFSINHVWDRLEDFDEYTTTLSTCNEMNPAQNDPGNFQSVEESDEVVYSYDVKWVPSDITWAHRWDVYLKGNPDDKIHWFSITNSTMIVVFLTVMVAMILVRTLNSDIAQYNDPGALEDAKEESGWKLCHADVFRAPAGGKMLLSVLVGTGMQLLFMTAATLVFALMGFLSPANRGSLLTALLLLYVFMGSVAGYHSSRMFKFFKGENWMRNTMMTAFLFPGFVFTLFMILNTALIYEGSSGAVPISTFVTLIVLWFGVSTPLVFVGSYFGYKKEAYSPPVRVNLIPRQIPPQPWYMSSFVVVFFGGVLPFGAVSVELFFIMSALWLHQIYYIFGFLFLVMIILVATCAETTILMCYFQLCNEDYRWWWRSMLSSGSCAGYIFLYSVWYFFMELDINGMVPAMLYFGYMSMISLAFFILTGSIGFYSCFWFVNKIYGSIKVD